MLMVVRIVIDLVGPSIQFVPAQGIMVQDSGCRSVCEATAHLLVLI